MKIYNAPRVVIIFVFIITFSTRLLAQKDVSIKFSFNKSGEYICAIQNISDHEMLLWLSKEEADIRSNLYFYVLNRNNDTVPVYRELYKDPKKLILHLDAEETYTISYGFQHPERFVKARVFVNYGLKGVKSKGFYEKTLDLREVRNKAYIPQVLRDEKR